jgi:hypothetical protein
LGYRPQEEVFFIRLALFGYPLYNSNKCSNYDGVSMPVNFLQLNEQVSELGRRARHHEKHHQDLLGHALDLLRAYAHQGDRLRQRIEKALAENKKLRCAVPLEEPLDQPTPFTPFDEQLVLLAADGSQVNPSWHDAFPFCIINVGAIRLNLNLSESPQEYTHTQLLYYEDILTPAGLLTESEVALMRDLNERTMLSQLAEDTQHPVVALTDGPLELYSETHESEVYRKSFIKYLHALQWLREMRVAAAGYVDKPRGDLVIRLLELASLPEQELSVAGRVRPMLGVTDAEIYAELLAPGERSALFAIQSISTSRFEGELALHFFYLNIGRAERPSIARVEIPAWLAADEKRLNMLQSTLISQCQPMANDPYPYALHRAHEIAVVSFDEKEHISNMIAQEHYRQGIPFGRTSSKQALKDHMGSRKRYQ